MFTGVPLVERVKRLVERQIRILETWSEGAAGAEPQGLSGDQLDQLKTLAMIARQLDLDNLEPSAPQHEKVDASGASVEDLLAQIPSKK